MSEKWVSSGRRSLLQTRYLLRKETAVVVRIKELKDIGKFDVYTNIFLSVCMVLLSVELTLLWSAFLGDKITPQELPAHIALGIGTIGSAYLARKFHRERLDIVEDILNQPSDSSNPESAAARSTFMPPTTSD